MSGQLQEIGQLSSKIVGPGGISKKMRAPRWQAASLVELVFHARAHVKGDGLMDEASTRQKTTRADYDFSALFRMVQKVCSAVK